MEENSHKKNKLKNTIKKVLKSVLKKFIPLGIILLIVAVILAAADYWLTIDDGIFKDDDMSSTPYAASTYINSTTVEKDGNIKSKTSSKELWDEMKKNGSRVDSYLSNSKELARLMKAEIVTKYPDTREDPDKEIDWNEVIENEDQLQGIVKFKRAQEGQKTDEATTMTYVDPETFQGYIDEYNSSGSQTAKENALKHFTLRKTTTSNVRTSGGIGSFEKYPDLTEEQLRQLATVALQEQGDNNPKGNAAELSIMANLYEKNKDTNGGYSSVWDYVYRGGWFSETKKYMKSCVTLSGISVDNHPEIVELARTILVDGKRTLPGYVDEHDSVADIESVTNDGASINKNDSSQYISHTSIVHQSPESFDTPIDWIYYCHPTPQCDPFGYTSEERRAQIGELYYEFETWNEVNGTGNSSNNSKKDGNKKNNNKNSSSSSSKKQAGENSTGTTIEEDGYEKEYTSSAGITYKCYKQGGCNKYSDIPYSQGTVATSGCGPSSVAILASGLVDADITPGDTAKSMYERNNGGPTNSERLKSEMDTRGMTSEIVENPTGENIQSNLKDGKVMLASVNGGTIFTNNSHIITIVDINTDGQVYVCNPSRSTDDGWFDISEITKDCNYIVVTDAGASGVATTHNTSTSYAAVIATWTQVDTKLESDDPDVETYSETKYNMTTTTVNYQAMVQKYEMPFDFLWALLVVGEEKNFVYELADLVYNSDIQITVYDNLTINTDVDEWSYDKQIKVETEVNGKVQTKVQTKTYTVRKTVITQTNTVNPILTKADTWIYYYINSYAYNEPTVSTTQSTAKQDNEKYSNDPDAVIKNVSLKDLDSKELEKKGIDKKDIISSVQENNKDSKDDKNNKNDKDTKDDSGGQDKIDGNTKVSIKSYSRHINISEKVTNTTETRKYIEGTPITHEKTGKEVDEDDNPKELNFVTIFRKAEHINARKNILSVPEWLFEIVETNGRPDVDLVKYLLYKATGKDYGVTEYDFSEYDASKFKSSKSDMVRRIFRRKNMVGVYRCRI